MTLIEFYAFPEQMRDHERLNHPVGKIYQRGWPQWAEVKRRQDPRYRAQSVQEERRGEEK